MAASHPLRLSEETLEAEFGLVAPLLARLRIIERLDDCTEAECPGGPNACLKTVTPHRGRLYVTCDCEEGVGLVTVPNSSLSRVQLDLKGLLSWLAKELSLTGGVQPIADGESWFLGRSRGGQEGTRHYFLRSDSAGEARKFLDSLQQERPIVYWLGERPHKGIFPKNLISLDEAIEPRKTGFVLNRDVLSKAKTTARHTASGKALILDEHIGMDKEGEVPFLLFDREADAFQHKKRIRPQAFELIRFLHTMRTKKDRAFTLGELLDRQLFSTKTIASTRIREINDICADYEAKPLLHKFPGEKWGLNPNLEQHT